MSLNWKRTQRISTDAIAIATKSRSTNVSRCRISRKGAEMTAMDGKVLRQVSQIKFEGLAVLSFRRLPAIKKTHTFLVHCIEYMK